MSRLLNAGFSRLKKSKCFRGFMIFMFLFGGYIKIAEFYNQEKYNTSIPLDSGLFVYVTVIGILLAAFISLFIGTEYNDGTIRNKLVIGHTRSAIYLSNLIVCLAAGLLMCLSFLCASLLIGIPLSRPLFHKCTGYCSYGAGQLYDELCVYRSSYPDRNDLPEPGCYRGNQYTGCIFPASGLHGNHIRFKSARKYGRVTATSMTQETKSLFPPLSQKHRLPKGCCTGCDEESPR